jgi:hypothetical protein
MFSRGSTLLPPLQTIGKADEDHRCPELSVALNGKLQILGDGRL